MKNIKLQYYLRGLGVGMLVTAIVMGVTVSGEEKELTDAQIRELASELGMVDGDSIVLSDLQGQQFAEIDSEEETESVIETESVEQTENTTLDETRTDEPEEITSEAQPTEEQMAEEQLPEETTVEESTVTEDLTSQPRVVGEVNAEGNTVTIVIRSGANSYSVSKILEDNGLVADAKEYDRFLCDSGYSKKIRTGTYLIAIETNEEEIAKIITGNR